MYREMGKSTEKGKLNDFETANTKTDCKDMCWALSQIRQ